MNFHNKKIVITGGTAGIGKAIAVAFAKKGAHIALFGTNEERAQDTISELDSIKTNADQNFRYFLPPIQETEAVSQSLQSLLSDWENIDILINNAGITRDSLLARMSEKDWDDVIAVNLKSMYNTCRVIARPMMKARSGKIINISSIVALSGNIGQTNYASSKAGVIGFTKSLALELARWNVCVNCITPGYIRTRMTEKLPSKYEQELLTKIPLGRIGSPEEVAELVLFLATAEYITGQVYAIDGGMTMS